MCGIKDFYFAYQAEGERSFSKLALISPINYESQDRVSHLVSLSTEYDLARSLNYDSIIDLFAARKARKVNLKT